MRLENQQYSATSECKIIRLPKVREMVGLGRSSVYANIKLGKFPAPIKLGARASGWILSEVEAWISARITASREIGGAK